MRTVPLCLIFAALASATHTDNQRENSPLQFQTFTNSDNGILGVASIAGVMSRNGRVSSLGGIQFYPGSDPISRDYNFPLTVSAEKDGRYATGTIETRPGFISTSASAGYGPSLKTASRFVPNLNTYKPYNDYFFQAPPEPFVPSLENWLSKEFFRGFPPSAPEEFRGGWPGFNPFMNFWR